MLLDSVYLVISSPLVTIESDKTNLNKISLVGWLFSFRLPFLAANALSADYRP